MEYHRSPEQVIADHQRRVLRKKYCVACSTRGGEYCRQRCLLGEKKAYNTIALAEIARISAPHAVANVNA